MRAALRIAVPVLLLALVLTPPVAAENEIPVAGIALPDNVTQTFGERSAGTFDAAAFAFEQQALAKRLAAIEVAEGIASPIVVAVSRDEILEIANDKASTRRYRVGLSKPVGATIDLAFVDAAHLKAERRLEHGAIRETDDGGYVWTAVVSSPGATALRLHFSDFWLPAGSELYVYNRLGEAFGPYTGAGPLDSGDFWSHTVAGEEMMLQLRHSGTTKTEGLISTYFVIEDLGYLGERYLLPQLQHPSARNGAKKDCTFNADCVEGAGCTNTAPVVEARDAVAYMLFTSGRFQYICSGGLLADSDTGSEIPYFLTANHCISKSREASSLQTTFFFTSECGSCTAPGTPSTLGAGIVSSNRQSDYTLLQLAEPAPSGAAFLGWNSSPVASANGTNLYRISHPAGAPQAYSEHDVDTSYGTCSSWPRGGWIYSRDVFGATEGGSSGSPVVNGAGQVVGQLSGACGTNVSDNCDPVSNATVDGAFAAYYSEVAPWLAGGSCADNDGDTYADASCGGDDCNDTDPLINPGALEICTDGVDNDCNGLIDNDDPFCSGGECSPAGDSCTSNSDCCSLKCKGKPGAKICR